MYRWLTKYFEFKREYDYLCLDVEKDDERKKELEEKMKKIKEFINYFDDIESIILAQKYIHNQTLRYIADYYGYSYQAIKNKHAELVKIIKFSDIMRGVNDE